jgi:AraC family ethanolamine operon transcriptional activator
MECRLTACVGEDYTFFSLSSNRSIFFCSDKKGDKTAFSCMDSNLVEAVTNLRNYSNDLSHVAKQILGGFTTRTSFRHFHLPANIRWLNYSCKTEKLVCYMKENALNYEAIANQAITILPSDESLSQFRSVVKSALRHNNGNEDTKVEPYNEIAKASLVKCFDSSQQIKSIPIKETQRHALCKDLVVWGYANVDMPLSLEIATQKLHTTRASLSQGCKEALGIGPMEILRNIRLEHVYKTLASSEIMKESNLRNVDQIREHYGFMSRGNFAATYKNCFDERPKQTQLKSQQNIQ